MPYRTKYHIYLFHKKIVPQTARWPFYLTFLLSIIISIYTLVKIPPQLVQDIHVKVEKKQETINQNQEKERDNQKQVANAYSKVLVEIKNLNIKNSTAGENLSPMDCQLPTT